MKQLIFGAIALNLVACAAEPAERTTRAHEAFTNAIPEKLVTSIDVSTRDFGSSVATDGQSIVVAANANDSNTDSVAALFTHTTAGWKEDRVFTPPDPDSLFAQSLAVAGDSLVIGGGGRVLTYRASGGQWSDEATLEGDPLDVDFGDAVALEADRLIVGDAEDIFPDSAYVFERSGSSWTQIVRLQPSASADVQFGRAVALSGDVAVVGAPGPVVPHVSGDAPGSVHVFRLQAGSWVETQTLQSSDLAEGDRFGEALAFRGSTLIVGAWRANGGKMYVFDDVGGTFQQSASLKSALGGVSFGFSVTYDGSTLMGGTDGVNDSGRVESFALGAGNWVPGPVLSDLTLPAGSGFGAAVAVSGDSAVVGAPPADLAYAYSLLGDKKCTPDATGVLESNGTTTPCAPYFCSQGACATSCKTSNECTTGNVCDTSLGQGQCVASKKAAAAEDSGGCQTRRGAGHAGFLLLSLFSAWLWLSRRRRHFEANPSRFC